MWLGLAPRTPSVIQDNFSMELDQSVQFSPVRCPEIRDVRYSGVFNVHNYSEFRRDMKTRPLFGICPLFGVSVKREFTVLR